MLTNGIEPFILAVERNYTGDTKLIFIYVKVIFGLKGINLLSIILKVLITYIF